MQVITVDFFFNVWITVTLVFFIFYYRIYFIYLLVKFFERKNFVINQVC